MPTITSSIKDTDDFIRRIRNIIDLPSDVLLVTFDVVSLYPSIQHDFGLCALKDFLLDHNLPNIVVNGIHNMTDLVLKKNVFEFNSECFLQTSGTAIGTKMAPAYAKIVMSIFECNLLQVHVTSHWCGFDILMTSLLSGHTVKTNLMILCFTLILSTHLFILPVIIPRNMFSFWMSQIL